VRSPRRLLAALALSCALVTGTFAHAAVAKDSDASPPDLRSIDPPDAYFPGLGNAGYDVRHYDLALTIDPNRHDIDGVATITAKTTARLTRFDLDLLGFDVQSVRVDGKPATVTRQGRELRIRPGRPLADKTRFVVVVEYHGTPTRGEVTSVGLVNGWLDLGGTVLSLGEPDGASRWFPANDHPRDKATFTFRLTVPEGLVGVANGKLRGMPRDPAHPTWVWNETAPMATYLAQVGVGDFVLDQHDGPAGILVRNAIATSLRDAAARSPVSQTDDMLSYFSKLFGPYPFDVYGVLVADAPLGFGFEAQTLTVVGADALDAREGGRVELAHELVQQWFGDSVSPSKWQDVWLNEGFATYGEWLWSEHALGVPLAANVEEARRAVGSGTKHPVDDPSLDTMFDGALVYERGALVLHALRGEVGDDTFFEILRSYAKRYGGGTASTKDFIRVAQKVSGRSLKTLFDAWLAAGPLPGSDASGTV
jgi:aminopeptidase N